MFCPFISSGAAAKTQFALLAHTAPPPERPFGRLHYVLSKAQKQALFETGESRITCPWST